MKNNTFIVINEKMVNTNEDRSNEPHTRGEVQFETSKMLTGAGKANPKVQ